MHTRYNTGTYKIPEIRLGKLSLKGIDVRVLTERMFPREQMIVGFMGSAGKEPDHVGNEFQPLNEDKTRGEKIGEIIAGYGAILSNGGVWGVPYFPLRGAYKSGGYTMAISPFPDETSHLLRNPLKHLHFIIYVGIACPIDEKFNFIIRDAFNTLYPNLVISRGGRWGTFDEDVHVIEQGGVLVLDKGSGSTTDSLIGIVESKKIEKDTGARIIIPKDESLQSLEEAIGEGMAEAQNRWKKEGRTQNRFAHVIDELEK
ncbi:hypothetical protein HYX05_00450, partial [Candidatus Woesearchaeota archaeon]|nr:hypothetical protein [Candidatus Woesearchaeota archaeon]